MQRKSGPTPSHRTRASRRSRADAATQVQGGRTRPHRRRLTGRGRLVIAAGALAIFGTAGFVYFSGGSAAGIIIPTDACASPPPLVTWNNVTLQPLAMAAFKAAQHDAGQRIPVVWSYRSCAQQRVACENICGAVGCQGRCAPPGKSWHQMGAAIDTTQHGLDTPAIVAALKANKWCQPLPGSDPGHFSFGGCH